MLFSLLGGEKKAYCFIFSRLTLLWFLATSIACFTSGGTVMLLYTDFPFSFSNFCLYSFCGKITLNPKTSRSKLMPWNMNILDTRTYRTRYFVHHFAVGCITGLRHSGERARLTLLFAGQLVFALQRSILIRWQCSFVLCVNQQQLLICIVKIYLRYASKIKLFYYLRNQTSHWFSMKDLRGIMDSMVVSFSLLVLLPVFDLVRKNSKEFL